MQWLPTPPTDCLYKYVALNGLYIGIAALLSLGVLHYQQFENQQFNETKQRLISQQASLTTYEARLNSLATGKVAENTIPGLSGSMTPKNETAYLEGEVVITRERMKRLTQKNENPPTDWFPLVMFFRIDIVLVFLLVSAVLMVFFGFGNWKKSQGITDEIKELDRNIKRTQLRDLTRARFRRHGG
jgi:hypothetical protein